MNKFMCIGRLGGPPDEITGGCKLCIALRARGSDDTLWAKVLVFGELADQCRNHLTTGDRVYVEGRLEKSKAEESRLTIVGQIVDFL